MGQLILAKQPREEGAHHDKKTRLFSLSLDTLSIPLWPGHQKCIPELYRRSCP